MSIVFDESLLEEFEKEKPDFDRIIERSIDLKRQIVQEDEKKAEEESCLILDTPSVMLLKPAFLSMIIFMVNVLEWECFILSKMKS